MGKRSREEEGRSEMEKNEAKRRGETPGAPIFRGQEPQRRDEGQGKGEVSP